MDGIQTHYLQLPPSSDTLSSSKARWLSHILPMIIPSCVQATFPPPPLLLLLPLLLLPLQAYCIRFPELAVHAAHLNLAR